MTRICYTLTRWSLSRRAIALVLVLLLAAPPAAAQRSAQARPAPGQAPAQPSVLDDAMVQFQVKRGLDLLYNMKFDQARTMFDLIDRRFPDHPIGPFLKALDTWWRILLDLSDESNDPTFFKAMDDVVARSDRLLKRDPDHFDAMFFKGAALGFRGRLRSNRGDWFKAAQDGLKAMDYVLGVAKKDPGNADYAFGKGIYDYYADVVPDRYPFARPVMVFFPDGDRARGLAELERTAKEGRFIQTEAAYFLLQIYYLFERDYDKSVEYATWLRERYPDNAFFHAFEGRVYARWGHWTEATRIFTSVLDRYKQKKTGYNAAAAEQSLYFLARGRMVYSDHAGALVHLNQLEALGARNDRQGYFKVMGRLRQGMAHDALGHREQAAGYYRQVLALKDHGDAHERAREYLQFPYSE